MRASKRRSKSSRPGKSSTRCSSRIITSWPGHGEDDAIESSRMDVLIVNPRGIFGVAAHRTVQEFSKFYAFGSGGDIAMGVLYAAFNDPKTFCGRDSALCDRGRCRVRRQHRRAGHLVCGKIAARCLAARRSGPPEARSAKGAFSGRRRRCDASRGAEGAE